METLLVDYIINQEPITCQKMLQLSSLQQETETLYVIIPLLFLPYVRRVESREEEM